MSDIKLMEFDRGYIEKCGGRLAGMDEVGRGALAGPVVVGCIHIDFSRADEDVLGSVDDSKKLSKRKREDLYQGLSELRGVSYGMGTARSGEIDELGINEATDLAAERAYRKLADEVDLVLADSGLHPSLAVEIESIQKGDSRSLHVAGASVLAKVFRDRMMVRHSRQYPTYKWETNVGYGTTEHIEAIRERGPSPLHRRSYKLG